MDQDVQVSATLRNTRRFTIPHNLGALNQDSIALKVAKLLRPIEPKLGSQIEADVFSHVVAFLQGMDVRVTVVDTNEAFEAASDAGDFVIFPQVQFGKYRVDFVMAMGDRGVIVECDGREYHHSTREQIERDRERDADLKEAGWKVLRFPGTQIHNDPGRVTIDICGPLVGHLVGPWLAEMKEYLK